MAALNPAVAAIRTAVRSALAAQAVAGPGAASRVLVACSGGADSLALAAAAGFVAPRLGVRTGLITVDHQLQPGSADRAEAVADWARKEGFDPVIVQTVGVEGRSGGPEAAARDARYEGLIAAARAHDAPTVLLGHTRDDQAETVLLALLRGAGPRGLAGMPTLRHVDDVAIVRPLLDVPRAQTRAACLALGLVAWEDPHNADPAYGRARTRVLLQSLVDSLGPSVVSNLAQTARRAAVDEAALARAAAGALADCRDEDGSLAVAVLAELAEAVRTRVLHAWARSLGAPGAGLSHRHVRALDALIVTWHGQGPVHLPGGITVTRSEGRLRSRSPRP